MAEEVLQINDDALDDSIPPEDRVIDDDLVLQRYNSQLPPSYLWALETERKLLIRALHVLVVDITNSAVQDDQPEMNTTSTNEVNSSNDEYVAEGYQHEIERDFAALEKGISRYLDLKHAFDSQDYPVFFDAVLRGALTPNLDMGLRSKLARCASRLLSKRYCELPSGVPWRRIVDQITNIHIDCVNGTAFIGKDVRDSHCRNFLSLLSKCRLFLSPDDSAKKIWDHFSESIHSTDLDVQFQNLLILTNVLPTLGSAWTDWVKQGMKLWQLYESSCDWDSIWMTLISRVSRHQPCLHDWTEFLPWIYTRIEDSCLLPIGAMTPQGSVDRRCPSHLYFLMDLSVIPVAARFCIYSLSPKYPSAMHYLKRFFALVANYFHPSNSGRWCNNLGSFLSSITSALVARITDERHATEAGKMDRVIGSKHVKGVAPLEHRLTQENIQQLIDIILPLIDLGLHSKVHSMSVQAATSARDLSIIQPDNIIPPFLRKASEGLESISSPHRTTAALRLLSALTPVFLDRQIFSDGHDYLQEALQLTLPGIDPNDPGKTESTLRFIGGATARIQGITNLNPIPIPGVFFDDYMLQLLERIFALLDSLEAPPKKNPNGGYGGAQPLSFIIFAVAMENLFVSLPHSTAITAAKKIAKQLTGAACSNAMKYYGALVRISCAVVSSNSSNQSAVNIFIPPLLDQLLEQDDKDSSKLVLISVGDDEMVWRIRMLAQACRCCGSGIDKYIDKIMKVIELSFDQPERSIYKSGGRLLRGLLEGLTIIQMKFDVGNGDESDMSESANGDVYKLAWKVPTKNDWKIAEDVLIKFVDRIESICPISETSDTEQIIAHRDFIFRILRMLHAAQRGGRWLLAGAMPKHFLVLDKYVDENIQLNKKDAKLILKRPVAAGLGGERNGDGNEFATKLWTKIYTIAFKIMKVSMLKRPDDGALLYRCLEPFELAHEPFRHGSLSRNTLNAARSYKSAYRPVIASKRPFGSEGGVGRAMPRFIVKLRIEAHHDMRLTVSARGGMANMKLCEEIVEKLTDLSLNDFPKVRGEARGVLTRALRIIRPQIRRKEITSIISVLRNSVSKSIHNEAKDESGDTVMKDATTNSTDQVKEKKEDDEVLYEKMIGASSVLRSSAAAPMIMRDTRLFSEVMRAFLEAMPKAERPEAASGVANLFIKLSSLVRPLGIDTIRIVDKDLVTVPSGKVTLAEEKGRKIRLEAYNELNDYLLGVLKDGSSFKSEEMINGEDTHHTENNIVNGKNSMTSPDKKETSQKGEAHWRVQSLVAILLLLLIREDRQPTAGVAQFFMRGVVSDVVALRHICSRGVSLILALHGRKAEVEPEGKFDSTPGSWAAKKGKESIGAMGQIACNEEFAKKVVHTLALDHDDDGDEGSRRGGDLFAILMHSRVLDGEASWTGYGGKSWPTSWTPRSRDTLNLVRIRFYEGLIRVYGLSMIQSLMPCIRDLVKKLEDKHERIISGVKDEDVRVLTAELLSAVCRGFDLPSDDNIEAKKIEQEIISLVKSLLNDMTGPLGNTNGAALIRLIGTAEPFTVGPRIMRQLLNWQLESKPLIVEMGNGPHAHVQARRLRYIHSCVADVEVETDEKMILVVKESVDALLGEVGLNHELKTVREEVGRLLSLLAVSVCDSNLGILDKAILTMSDRLLELESKVEQVAEDEREDENDKERKSRSRQGETLSRFVSILYWNGRARKFEPFIAKVIPSLFRSFDESDQERISHSKMALSLAAQGCFKESTIEEMLLAAEKTVEDKRWKVRGSVLGFLQIFSFCSLFLASDKSLGRVRKMVYGLLSDSQIEVRQSAAAAFVTMIRDAEDDVVRELRDRCLKALKETSWRGTGRGRKKKKASLEGDVLFKRHGAVLGLSSMVTCSPYSVPEWMPDVLVALSDCVNDPPPICTGVRTLFGDFMRTHRDEWQMHKLAFTPDELDIVSELLVSPSYYA